MNVGIVWELFGNCLGIWWEFEGNLVGILEGIWWVEKKMKKNEKKV